MAIALSTLDGTTGFRLDGFDFLGKSGRSVASAGDVNGDGFDDIIIGAYHAYVSGNNPAAGHSYVVFGKAGGFSSTFALSSLDGTNGFRINGKYSGDESGRTVASAGDVNGDGFDDVIVAAYLANPHGIQDAGETYVVYGKAGGFGSAFNLSSIDGTNGFRLNGFEMFENSGSSAAGAGDINGDGFADLLVGNRFGGESYVVFGSASGFGLDLDLNSLDGINGFRLAGSGYAVAGAGDINGDGFDDMVIDGFVVFGKAGGFPSSIDLGSLDGVNGFRVIGAGRSVSSAGDVNGDGLLDLLIGVPSSAPGGDREAGSSYVVFGKTGGFGASIDVSSLDGSNGFRLDGIDAFDKAGHSVASAGDINGDGFDDLLIGAVGADDYTGESYVVFGKAGGFSSAIDLASLNGVNGFRLNGVKTFDRSGESLARAGDINGDGFDDIIIGAYGFDFSTTVNSTEGVSYVIFGSATVGGSANRVTHQGGDGVDGLVGTAGADVMVGGRGNDNLDGAGGADSLRGGEGHDILGIDDSGFGRVDGGNGSDMLYLTGAMTLADSDFRRVSNMESIILTDNAVNLTLGRVASQAFGGLAVSGFSVTITADSSFSTTQTINAADFNHSLVADFSNNTVGVTVAGGLRADLLWGGSANDTLNGGGGNDTLLGRGGGSDLLDGGAGADYLYGNDGADILIGGAGADVMSGDAGDDYFRIMNASEVAAGETFLGGDGIDRIVTQIAAGDYVIDLTFMALSSIEAIWFGDPSAPNSSKISVIADQFGDGLALDAEIAGNSSASVKNVFSVAMNDTVSLDLSALVMKNFEQPLDQVVVTGDTDDESITGTNVADRLSGAGGYDILNGGGGNDVLDGGQGIDTLNGGGGNDIFYVDNAGDVVREATGGGNDHVAAQADFALGAGQEIELLTTTNSTAARSIDLRGNELAQTIVGNNGNNRLHDGGVGGADTLRGRDGNDYYTVYNSDAVIIEAKGQGEFDRLAAGVDYVLAQGVEIESLRTTSQYAIYSRNLTGNELGQQIIGNDGDNRIDGKGGSDTIQTGLGRDTIVFATALGAGNVDKIIDFSVTTDQIALDDAIFTALGLGALDASAFKDNILAPRDADDRILYNSTTGSLFYDADGLGGTAAVRFASLASGLALTAADFVVI